MVVDEIGGKRSNPLTLYEFVLTKQDNSFYIRTLKELNEQFNILWDEN